MASGNARASLKSAAVAPAEAQRLRSIERWASGRNGDSYQSTWLTMMVVLGLAFALLGGAGAALYQHTRPSVYTAAATLLVDQPSQIASVDNDGPLAKLQRVRYQYVSLLDTDVIGAPVARQLNMSAGAVEGALSGRIDPLTFTFSILARSGDAPKATQLAQAAANQLTSYVSKNQAQNGVAPVNRIELTEVIPPHGAAKTYPSKQRQLIAGVVGFVVVAAGFVIVADLLRRRR